MLSLNRLRIPDCQLEYFMGSRGKWRAIRDFQAIPGRRGTWTVNRRRMEAALALFPLPSPWPLWLRPLQHLAHADDRGLGDIIHRLLGPIGRRYPAWYLKIFGRDCGCSSKRAGLNRKFPLKPGIFR